MDLKIKDVAELLNVSENTVRRWLSEGKIPAYHINQQYRFNRLEIEDWVMSHKVPQEKSTIPEASLNDTHKELTENRQGSRQFSLYRALHKGGILNDMEGTTKEDLIRNTMKILSPTLHRDADILSELFIDRELLMSTSLNHKIAVPHARDCVLQGHHHDIVTVVFPKKPIPWGSLDGQAVEVLFFLFACNDKRHLNLLAKIAHVSSNSSMRSFLLSHPPHSQLLEKIKTWETNLHTQ